ncbi:MAG: YfiR family protein [Arenimonas sp.]
MAKTEIQASEYRVKAAFVYKFGDYIEWPTEAFSTPNSPLLIGVVGADALADELVRISSGRTISGRPVIVKKLKYGESLPGSHMIFIGRSNNEQIAAVLDANKERPTLTVTESEDGLKLGSMINMVVVSDKVRFDVALPRAEAGRLKISSRLLAVARKVVVSKP